MASPKELVAGIYQSFGKGDIPAILAALDENMDWHWHGPKSIPFAGHHVGKAAVGKFFQAVGANAEVLAYEPREFLVGPDHVTVIGWQKIKARPTGKIWEAHFCHVWSLKGGKAVRVHEYYDTAAVAEAFKK